MTKSLSPFPTTHSGGAAVSSTATASSETPFVGSGQDALSGDGASRPVPATVYTALALMVESVIKSTYAKKEADDGSTSPADGRSPMQTSPAPIVQAPEYAGRIARDILDGAETWFVGVGGTYGLNLREHSCEICGGWYPQRGEAVMFLDRSGHPLYLHVGCWRNAADWAPRPVSV